MDVIAVHTQPRSATTASIDLHLCPYGLMKAQSRVTQPARYAPPSRYNVIKRLHDNVTVRE